MEKLIPMDVSIRQQELERNRKQQREQFNQKLHNQYFDGAVETTDRKSAFRDEHIASAYAQIRTNGAKMKDDMVHATSSAPYNRKGRN